MASACSALFAACFVIAPSACGGADEDVNASDANAPDSARSSGDAGDSATDALGTTSDASSSLDARSVSDGDATAPLVDAAASYACDDVHSVPAGYTSIKSLAGGTVHGDGVHVDGPAIAAVLAANTNVGVCFPDGDYLLDNADLESGLLLQGYSGKLLFSAHARLVCDTATSKAGQCLEVENSTNVAFTGLTVTYAADAGKLPLLRDAASPDNGILVGGSTNISFENATVDTSPGVGIWITNSKQVTVDDTSVNDTSADGLHFENVLAAAVSNFTSKGTGDDGLACTNIAQTDPNCGFTATGIHVYDSLARGIIAVGCCDVKVSDFDIHTTNDPGISTSQDPSINSRRPTRVSFASGTIEGSGQHCGEIAAADMVAYDAITCTAPTGDGFFIYSAATDATVTNSTVTSPGSSGYEVSGSSGITWTNDSVVRATGNGYSVIGSQNVNLSGVSTSKSGGYGLYHSSSSAVTEQMLVVTDAARTGGNDRAWWAENMTGAVTVTGLQVVDDQAKATGYIVGDHADGTNAVNVALSFAIAHGTGMTVAGGASSKYTVAP